MTAPSGAPSWGLLGVRHYSIRPRLGDRIARAWNIRSSGESGRRRKMGRPAASLTVKEKTEFCLGCRSVRRVVQSGHGRDGKDVALRRAACPTVQPGVLGFVSRVVLKISRWSQMQVAFAVWSEWSTCH